MILASWRAPERVLPRNFRRIGHVGFPFLGAGQERSDCPSEQRTRHMKPALLGQVFEGLARFFVWNTLASRCLEDEADRAYRRKPDRHACAAGGIVVRQ